MTLKKTQEMSLEERTELEAQINAENLRKTTYQTPSDYTPSKEIKVKSADELLQDVDLWLADLDLSERNEIACRFSERADSGLLIGAGKTDFVQARKQLVQYKAELHYLRGLEREEAGDLVEAQKDFAQAAAISPEQLLYKSESRRLLKSCMILPNK